MTASNQAIIGIDAYELAWDVMSANLWPVVRMNTVWFLGGVFGLIVVLIMSAATAAVWKTLLFLSVPFLLIYSALWEAANIAKFSTSFPCQPRGYPVLKIVLARLLFFTIVLGGYVLFVLPGIYLHCRLCLYLPLLVHKPKNSITNSFAKSWEVTSSHFLIFYTLWIAIVVSKPVCSLPFGLGFILERPASGLAKSILFGAYAEPGDQLG